ncbi:MAG: hypothetical protein QGI45_01965 [Myxococcota bacterium]|jgi:hypothetical protein|nr:hypothetical protein [Myxococcota bacterium]
MALKRTKELHEAHIVHLAFLVLVLIAFLHTWTTTANLSWSHDDDIMRDTAHAQTILDGDFLGDPHYKGETIWYNPVLPALVAGLSALSGEPVHEVYAQFGPLLNLWVPIVFYLFVVAFMGHRIGLAAAFAFLFLSNPEMQSYSWASYSAWLYNANFAQGFFYLALIVLKRTLEHKDIKIFLLFGFALGITFLCHVAPALLLGAIFVSVVAKAVWHAHKNGRLEEVKSIVRNALLALVTAFLVGLPLIVSILGNYSLIIKNTAPSAWIFEPLLLERMSAFFLGEINFINLLALLGLYRVCRTKGELRSARLLLLTWGGWALAFFFYGYLRQLAANNGLFSLNVVPEVHFLFYLRALASVCVGIALVFLCEFFVRRFLQNKLRETPPETQLITVLILVLALVFVSTYDTYSDRHDFVHSRRIALHLDRWVKSHDVYDWLREYTQPEDVFLTTNHLALFIVGPAGRKVVAVHDNRFSNPYVDWKERLMANNMMLEYLAENQLDEFRILAQEYGVTHVLVKDEFKKRLVEAQSSCLELMLSNTVIHLYRVQCV